ncbi:MAG: hypothetical protein ABI877_10435 [Gemmatimonadaceae bacterium]
MSELTHGQAALSAEMVLRIEKAFGVSMDLVMHDPMSPSYSASR